MPSSSDAVSVSAGYQPLVSPGIQSESSDKSEPAWLAFELKFVIAEEVAQAVQRWAAQHLEADPYADLRTGMYETTTLYLDTPALDVLNRTPGFRRRKFRLRRYGHSGPIHLERKSRSKDTVRKRRTTVSEYELSRLAGPLAELPADRGTAAEWSGDWFHQRIALRELRPTCMVTYNRTAFMKLGSQGVMRLTLDRHIRGIPSTRWQLSPVHGPDELLPGHVVCELKFRDTMPHLFKQLVNDLKLTPGSVSKYRRLMQAAGFEPTPPPAESNGVPAGCVAETAANIGGAGNAPRVLS